jgi:glycine cleavage system H lipoate-binding protein/ABC-type phosphate transport system substrate-binding protein
MKKTITLLISLLLMNYGYISGKELLTVKNPSTKDSTIVLSTPDLYNLSIRWANEFNKHYPEMKIKILAASDKKMTDKLIAKGNIGFVSNEYYSGFDNQSLWKIVVGRDVIVPVINSKNPFSDEICNQGISTELLTAFFNSPDNKNWGTLLRNNKSAPVNYYWVNDESIKAGLTGFLKTDQNLTRGMKVENGKELISAIQKDPYALGFCKMIDIFDFNNRNIVENIRLLPLDKNGNGSIDFSEKIYNDFNTFSRGVWIGKYPKSLISNIYSISSDQPKNENELAFLKWVLTDGQQYLYKSGFSDLLLSERQTTVDKLTDTKIYSTASPDNNAVLKTALLILASLIVTGFIVGASVRFLRNRKTAEQIEGSDSQTVFDENSVLIPKGVYFDKTHTWAFMEQNGIVKVGIDDFLQHIAGPLTRVKMKKEGESVKKGEPILSIIQNGKQLNLYAPVSGIIKEHNKTLDTDSSVINSSPFNDGWVYLIEPTNWTRENQLLFMADKYKLHIKNEFSRLKEFLALALKEDTDKYALVVLQDGGELRDGILSNLGPEVWEDFQTNFIDPSRQVWFYDLF